ITSFRNLVVLAMLALVSPLFTGCASSQALRASLADRNALIRDLQNENSAIRERLQLVTYDRDQLELTLSERAIVPEVEPLEASSPTDMGGAPFPALNDSGLSDVGVELERRGDSVVFTIPSAITFGSGSATLSSEGEAALNAVAKRLKADFDDKVLFFVEGHTDSERIRRSKFRSNRELAGARARAVHEHLVTQGHIEDQRFVVVSHGPHRPIDTNATAEGRARNRRVEIIVRNP
ncbi:MAG: OmpA family protein, partial [Planctomycetes bacterium]|nr:OmpA family protein [Planctomycetota bacterium]